MFGRAENESDHNSPLPIFHIPFEMYKSIAHSERLKYIQYEIITKKKQRHDDKSLVISIN